jgi:hypothetical protein
MKTSKVGVVAVAILMVVAGVGFGIAQACEWNVEALDSYFEYLPEDHPVLSFEDQEHSQLAKSPSGDMQPESP